MPSVYVCLHPVLSFFAAGKPTGVVVDCGESATHVVPIENGGLYHRWSVITGGLYHRWSVTTGGLDHRWSVITGGILYFP